MARISRKTQLQFGSTAGGTEIGEFGSKAAGSPAYTTDPDNIQTSRYLQGWLGAVIGTGSKRLPPVEDMNALQYLFAYQLGYLLQEGLAEYDSGTEYHQYSVVRKTGTYELYGSKTNTNTGNALPSATDNTDWQYLGDLADLADSGAIATYYSESGSANAYVASASTSSGSAPTAYFTGMIVRFAANSSNTGASTINVQGLGAKSIREQDGTTVLIAGRIKSGVFTELMYDGTVFRLIQNNTGTQLEAWGSSISIATNYQAATDLFVLGSETTAGELLVYSDATATPSTMRVRNGGASGGNWGLCCPIRKGDYFRVDRNGGTTAVLFTIPLQQ